MPIDLISIVNEADMLHEMMETGIIAPVDFIERLIDKGWYDIDIENQPVSAYHNSIRWEFS